MSGAKLVELESNIFSVEGDITVETVPVLLSEGGKTLAAASKDQLIIDLSGATVGSSACAALLLAWMRVAHLHHKTITYRGCSEKLMRIVRISNLESVLGLGA